MVRKMLREHNKRDRDVCNRDGRDVCRGDFAEALECLQEGEIRNPGDVLEEREVDDLERFVVRRNADAGEDRRSRIAREDTDDERDHFKHLLAVDRAEHGDGERDETANEADVRRSRGARSDEIADRVARERKSDDRDGRSDDDCRHDLVDPFDARELHDDRDNDIDETGEACADDQAEVTEFHGGNGARERGEHRAEERERASEEDRASELREEQVNERADACAEQRRRLAHAVADDGRDRDGRRHDREQLLQCEEQHLTEFRFVLNVVDQIHNVPPCVLLL